MNIKRELIRLCAPFALTALLLAGCKKEETYRIELPAVVNEILNDTSSIYHIDFSSYPGSLRNLPIGILGKDSSSLAALDTILNSDLFDNITGKPVRDSIRDYAGEHFIFRLDTDTSSYAPYLAQGRKNEIVERIVHTAALLLKDNVKIIIFASDSTSRYGYEAVCSLLENGGIPVKAVKNDGNMEEVLKTAYTNLRKDNLLAFRITPQKIDTIFISESPNVQTQDSTGRD